MIDVSKHILELERLQKWLFIKIKDSSYKVSFEDYKRRFLVTKEEKDSGTYDHFNRRLRERYGLNVTPMEYKKLCEKDIFILGNGNKGTVVGLMIIKLKIVLVLKHKFHKTLKTALPLEKLKREFKAV